MPHDREAWLAGQNDALLLAINGAPLEESLGVLARTAVEHPGPDVRCALPRRQIAGGADRERRQVAH